jgi:hypothetical protein
MYNFPKIRPVAAQLFHADREKEADMTTLTVCFRNNANAPAIEEVESRHRLVTT